MTAENNQEWLPDQRKSATKSTKNHKHGCSDIEEPEPGKENTPGTSAIGLVAELGIELLLSGVSLLTDD